MLSEPVPVVLQIIPATVRSRPCTGTRPVDVHRRGVVCPDVPGLWKDERIFTLRVRRITSACVVRAGWALVSPAVTTSEERPASAFKVATRFTPQPGVEAMPISSPLSHPVSVSTRASSARQPRRC